MLEVGGVVAARRQDDIDAAAVYEIHDGLERLPVAAVVADGALAERLRAALAAQRARDQRIRCARRDAQVVLEDVPDAILALDEVDARDVAVDALGRMPSHCAR